MNQKTLTRKQKEMFTELYTKGSLFIINEIDDTFEGSDYDKKCLNLHLKYLKQKIHIVVREMEDLEEIDL